jgi:hypothetical protein
MIHINRRNMSAQSDGMEWSAHWSRCDESVCIEIRVAFYRQQLAVMDERHCQVHLAVFRFIIHVSEVTRER